MANRKISDFTALTAPASGDTFAILDVDASGAEVNKKITYANVLGKAPDGSAAAPAFSFNSDTNSGISGGSDTLVLSTGGTAAISVDSSQNVTLSANLIVNGTTTTIDSTTLTVKDKNIEIAKGNGNDAAVDGAGITIDSTQGDKTWNWVDSTDAWTSSENIDLASGKVLKVAGTQVLSATNFTGTSAVATAVTVADESSDTSCNVLFATAATGNLAPKSGTNLTFNSNTGALTATSFVGALTGNVTGNASGSSGSCTGNSATATEATNVTVSANNSTDETVYPVFVDGATGTQGAETDTGLTYNPSSGLLTSTGFAGALTGNASTATALATARNIGGVSFDGTGNINLPGVNTSGNQDTSGTAAIATTVTVADESSDTSCNVLFTTAATGDLGPKSGTNLTFNSSSGVLTATGFAGDITGNVTGNTSGSSGSCTGNAATATALATARAINGVDFDGTGAITVTAAAGTLTGTTLKSTVVNSSLTSVGTLSSLASGAITTTDNLSVDNAKEVRLYEADSNGSAYVGIKGATDKGSEASYTISLPADAPTANQILKADASTPTNLTWATDSGGIPDTGGTFTGKVTHNYTSSVRIASGTTGQRDGSPGAGDLRFNTSNSEFEGYDGSSWGSIGGGGGASDFKYLALRNAANNGAASYPAADFTLVTSGTTTAISPNAANALLVSVSGVIQQPNTGSSTPSDGFAITGSTIKFATNISAAPDFIIYQKGAGVGNASTVTVADESSDTTCFPLFTTAATGDLAPKSGSNLAFNSSTGALTATSFVGSGANLTGLPAGVGGSAGVDFNDNVKARWGTGNDLELYHDGSNSYLVDGGTGNLFIRAAAALQVQGANGENMIYANQDGSVELYHNAVKKFETTSSGATITGVATVSNGIVETAATIGTNHTITSNYNAMSAGPVTVSATVTVPSGSVWTVI